MLSMRGRLTLTLDVRDWIARSEALPFLSFVPVSTAIAVESVRLSARRPGRPHHRGHSPGPWRDADNQG